MAGLQSSSEHVISKLKTREIQHMCQEDWENAKSLVFLFAQVDGINKPCNHRQEKVVDNVTNLLLYNMLIIPLSTEPSNRQLRYQSEEKVDSCLTLTSDLHKYNSEADKMALGVIRELHLSIEQNIQEPVEPRTSWAVSTCEKKNERH